MLRPTELLCLLCLGASTRTVRELHAQNPDGTLEDAGSQARPLPASTAASYTPFSLLDASASVAATRTKATAGTARNRWLGLRALTHLAHSTAAARGSEGGTGDVGRFRLERPPIFQGMPAAQRRSPRLSYVGNSEELVEAPAGKVWIQGDSPVNAAPSPELVEAPAGQVWSPTLRPRIPQDWANLFEEGAFVQFDSKPWAGAEFYRARSHEESVEFVIKAAPTNDDRTKRDLYMRRRLMNMEAANLIDLQGIVRTIDMRVYPNMSYILMDAAQSNLFKHVGIRSRLGNFASDAEKPTEARPLPLTTSMPMLIDLLQGIENLAKAGIVHNNLVSSNILVNGDRALINDFGSASLAPWVDKGDAPVEVTSFQAGAVDSAYRLAPEVAAGKAIGPASDVWALGLLACKMILGYVPTFHMRLRYFGEQTAEQREEIRQMIADEFRVDSSLGFEKLGWDVQALLRGMLDHNTDTRWSATAARAHATRIADARDINVPGETP